MARSAIVFFGLVPPALLAAAHGDHGNGPETITVSSVQNGSPAAVAGLEAGDVILRLAGRELTSWQEVQDVMAAHKPGDTAPIAVKRDGKTVELQLTFGERPDGGVSIGVSLSIAMADGAAEDGSAGAGASGASGCLAQIEDTYQLETLAHELGLDFSQERQRLQACVERDAGLMGPSRVMQFCENVFKVHCSGLDVLTEVGEALVRRCEEQLAESSGLDPRQSSTWRTCAQHEIFDRYALRGEVSDAAACQAALDACESAGETTSAIEEAPTAKPSAAPSLASWPQWGGPNRDFRAPAQELASAWPADGPKNLWRRELGRGYSAILYQNGRLYTMYREGEEEIIVSLDAASGETVWEHRYVQISRTGLPYGDGPSSTPLLTGDRLFTVGIAGTLHALKAEDGEVLWSRELWDADLNGNVLSHGYSSSPVAHQGKVIVPVGGREAGLVAFAQKDGAVEWKALDLRNSYSSPIVADVAGERQLVAFMAEELVGADPEDGTLLWRYPHANEWRHNVALPEIVGDTIFISSPQAGAKGLRLVRDGEAIRVEEVWSTRRVQLYHVSSVRVGDWVYGSTGTTSPAFMTAVDTRTGEIGWRKRGFGLANCVEADGKLVILDEDGVLYLTTATPDDLVVHAETQLLDRKAWTVPTIVGKMLYARDQREIVAVDLG